MVRFERKDTKKARAAVESLNNAKQKNSGYNTPEVNSALQEMFHGKCYICENKKHITSFQIEHLKAHHGDLGLKYDWENLFLSCAHCNNTKLGKYEPILDCSHVDVDQKIAFHFQNPPQKPELKIEALDTSIATVNTCHLLNDVYYGKTPQKKVESKLIRCEIRRQMLDFENYIGEYLELEDGEDKKDLYCKIEKELKNASEYTAFKRWFIRDNQELCKDLLTLLPC